VQEVLSERLARPNPEFPQDLPHRYRLSLALDREISR
jgi:hypothetical protein